MKYSVALERASAMRKNPTPAEHLFWSHVRKRGLGGYKFYRQYIIEHADVLGIKAFFIVDFYCHTGRLIIELDGDVHLTSDQKKYDQERTSILTEMEYEVIRFTNRQVLQDWDAVSSKILSRLVDLD